jgi:hypothetical protein
MKTKNWADVIYIKSPALLHEGRVCLRELDGWWTTWPIAPSQQTPGRAFRVDEKREAQNKVVEKLLPGIRRAVI